VATTLQVAADAGPVTSVLYSGSATRSVSPVATSPGERGFAKKLGVIRKSVDGAHLSNPVVRHNSPSHCANRMLSGLRGIFGQSHERDMTFYVFAAIYLRAVYARRAMLMR